MNYFYVTRNVLTEGIRRVKGEVHEKNKHILIAHDPSKPDGREIYFRTEWHRTYSEALERAYKVRNSTLGQIKTKLKKLKNLSFPEAEPCV